MKKNLGIWDNLKFYFQSIYRLSLSKEKQEVVLWEDLKELFKRTDFKHGVYEKEKYIELVFEIGNNKSGIYYYIISDGYYYCRVKIIEEFPEELTSELFIMATHFNNLLNHGVVIIDVENKYVGFHQKTQILFPLLYKGEAYEQLLLHYSTSKDIYWAFKKLVEENEEPAIIIADLFEWKRNQEEEKNEE